MKGMKKLLKENEWFYRFHVCNQRYDIVKNRSVFDTNAFVYISTIY